MYIACIRDIMDAEINEEIRQARASRRRRAISPRPTTFEATRHQSAADYFAERQARAKPGRALEILGQAPDRPEPDDEERSLPGRASE